MDYQLDCRFFSGYKPCTKNTECSSSCPKKEIAHPRILIIHLEAMGAVLRATVVLRAIKRKWPNAHVTWISSPRACALLENNPYIDRLLKNDHEGTLALSSLSFNYAFCIDKSLVAAGLLNVPTFITHLKGFGVDAKNGAIIALNKEAEVLYGIGLSNHEKFFVNTKTEGQLIVESLGLEYQKDEYVFEFTEDEKIMMDKDKKDLGLDSWTGPIIGLNTGCSPTIPYKKLTVRGWINLIDLMKIKIPEAKILLLGGKEDKDRNQQIFSMRPDVTLTPTDLGLRAGARFTQLCNVVITGDSLGMHMAIALKKWVVAWFGPTCAHEIEFYGRGGAVKTEASCSPCWKRFCDKAQMCYDQVDNQEIIRLALNGLKNNHPSASDLPIPETTATPTANA